MITTIIKRLILYLFILTLIILPTILCVFSGNNVLSGLIVSTIILCTILFYLFLKTIWLRMKEKKLAGKIQDNTTYEMRSEKPLFRELYIKWREAVDTVRTSNNKHNGDPLYTLPWYLVIGTSGSGKTTVIKNSGFSAQPGKLSETHTCSETKNCDWWFSDSAVIMDTAGRYTTQPDKNRDNEEWKFFLTQLSKHRKKETLNGLIVTVSSDRLLSGAEHELIEDGRAIRQRIQELMLVLGTRFPVYIIITKCDRISGMVDFANRLPSSSLEQAMGFVDLPESKDRICLEHVFSAINKRLQQFLFSITVSKTYQKSNIEIFLFSKELRNLEKSLELLTNEVFSQNPYKDTPFFRGVFFTSAVQHHSTVSEGINHDPVFKEVKDVQNSFDTVFHIRKKKTEHVFPQNCFLKEFFTVILPADRRISKPTSQNMNFMQKTRIFGFSVWVLLFLILSGLTTLSFSKTLSLIQLGKNDLVNTNNELIFSDFENKQMKTFVQLRKTIADIEIRNKKRLVPEIGLDQSLQMEKEAKKLFCKSFADRILEPFDEKIHENSGKFTDITSSMAIGSTVIHYTRRIRLLNMAIGGSDVKRLEQVQSPEFMQFITENDKNIFNINETEFKNNYLHYLAWQDIKTLKKEKDHLHKQLALVAEKKDLSLKWVIDWCNENTEEKPLTRGFLWTGEFNPSEKHIIPAAFTASGYEMIVNIFEDLERCLKNPNNLKEKKTEFFSWFIDTYQQTWLKFINDFPKGADTLKLSEKIAVANAIASDNSPFSTLIDIAARELPVCFDSETASPEWISAVLELSAFKGRTETTDKHLSEVTTGFFKKKKDELITSTKNAFHLKNTSSDTLNSGRESYTVYKKNLENLAQISTSEQSSFRLASEVFTEDEAMGQSALAISLENASNLKKNLSCKQDNQNPVNHVINSPIEFLWSLAVVKAGNHIQDTWNETVLSEIQGTSDPATKSELLYGKDEGLVTSFIKNTAAPFIKRTVKTGYFQKTAHGQAIPFNRSFLVYITGSSVSIKAKQPVYKVKIDGMPVNVNSGASVIPHMSQLELKCSDTIQNLKYLNYPVNRTFEWSPDKCSDVDLQISIGDISLKRKYRGEMAFPVFLKEFKNGQRIFNASDFPDALPALKRLNVKSINVSYKISGGSQVTSFLSSDSSRVPDRIVSYSK